jgi:hypothetical protein
MIPRRLSWGARLLKFVKTRPLQAVAQSLLRSLARNILVGRTNHGQDQHRHGKLSAPTRPQNDSHNGADDHHREQREIVRRLAQIQKMEHDQEAPCAYCILRALYFESRFVPDHTIRAIDRTLLSARPPVLSAARVKENCFSLSFIAVPSCQTWLRASTGNYCRVSGGFAPSPRAWAGGSGRAARQCARSSAIPGQTGPEEAGAGHKPAFKPAWKTTGLSRLAHSRNPGWGPRRHRVRTYRALERPERAGGLAGRARHRGGEGSSRPGAGRQ